MLAPELACTAGCGLAALFIVDSIRALVSLRDPATWFETGGAALFAAGTWCVALASQARQYHRPSLSEAPYVLYLRTFLGFSDRAMTAALFTIVGGRKRIVVLTSPHSNSAAWDPVLIAFRGNPVLKLSAESPVFVRASDHEWARTARQLVDGASHIVVDISDMSTGIRAELEMVGRLGISKKVIWLTEATQADRVPQIRALVGSAHMPPDRVISYERSWIAAWPNMLIGFGLSELFWVLSPTDYAGPKTVLTLRDMGYLLGYLTGRSLPALMVFIPIFARPAVDRRAQKALRALLVGA